MTLERFIKDMEEALSELPEGLLSGETEFKKLKAWDSLAVLTVTDTIEMEYGVLLKKEDYQACERVEALYELVHGRQ